MVACTFKNRSTTNYNPLTIIISITNITIKTIILVNFLKLLKILILKILLKYRQNKGFKLGISYVRNFVK